MKLLQQLGGLLKVFLAKSLVWGIIALLACFPLGILLLNIFDKYVDNEQFTNDINGQIDLLFALFCITGFTGIILIRLVATAIKTIVESKGKKK